jgi:four helix bundle protein
MATIKQFEDLRIWQEARTLAKETYVLIRKTELRNSYALRNQMERSAGSIMDNIAEGFERQGNREFIQFLSIAKGSCGELRSQLHRSVDVELEKNTEVEKLIEQSIVLSKGITAMSNYLRKSELKGNKFMSNGVTDPTTNNEQQTSNDVSR